MQNAQPTTMIAVAVTLVLGIVNVNGLQARADFNYCYNGYIQATDCPDVVTECTAQCGYTPSYNICVEDSPHYGWVEMKCGEWEP